jgi:hypothetical protein
MIELLKKYNECFVLNNSHGQEELDNIFEFTDYSSLLILSAPHATRSFCNKKEKCADLYTGALVQYLGEICNISSIIRTKFTPYKALILDYITEHNLQEHYFLDVHGFNQNIDYDICLGIGSFPEQNYPYLQEIINITQKYDLKIIVNHENYTGKCGLTGRYQKVYNKPCVIQIELKQYLRDFYNNPDVVRNITIPFFIDIIKCYE